MQHICLGLSFAASISVSRGRRSPERFATDRLGWGLASENLVDPLTCIHDSTIDNNRSNDSKGATTTRAMTTKVDTRVCLCTCVCVCTCVFVLMFCCSKPLGRPSIHMRNVQQCPLKASLTSLASLPFVPACVFLQEACPSLLPASSASPWPLPCPSLLPASLASLPASSDSPWDLPLPPSFS